MSTTPGAGPDKFVGDSGPGGSFAYPVATPKPPITNGVLTYSTMVSTYSGLGLYLDSCIDASKYTGISFTVASTGLPATAKISFSVQINSDLPVDVVGKKGACVPASAADPYPTCHDPVALIPVSGPVSLPFSTITGGLPTIGVNPMEIVGLKWQFPWESTSTAYPGTITISDLKFM